MDQDHAFGIQIVVSVQSIDGFKFEDGCRGKKVVVYSRMVRPRFERRSFVVDRRVIARTGYRRASYAPEPLGEFEERAIKRSYALNAQKISTMWGKCECISKTSAELNTALQPSGKVSLKGQKKRPKKKTMGPVNGPAPRRMGSSTFYFVEFPRRADAHLAPPGLFMLFIISNMMQPLEGRHLCIDYALEDGVHRDHVNERYSSRKARSPDCARYDERFHSGVPALVTSGSRPLMGPPENSNPDRSGDSRF
ncbi:hypothetical protein B0H11DRAFT_1912718 [Mycena galericulata]|nr:hypothetical protein B0H11DRAFT_1912718 [Mycena galericulata]